MDKEKILAEYRNLVDVNSVKARALIKKLDYKEDYYLLRCIAQTYLDECRFEDDGKSNMRVNIDRRKWAMAERYIIKAFKIKPDNAEVLYTMGEVRKIYEEQKDIAIYCFGEIIKLGVRKIASDKYSRGTAFAKELINDSKFELYRIYHATSPGLSKRYLSMYKRGLEKGVRTIFKPLRKFLLH
jgi:tetratricopeptide (TPR) repeat protein